MELKDYALALRKRWFIVLVCTLLGLLLAALATLLTPRVYEARTELFVAPSGGTSTVELVQGSSFVLDRVKSYVRVIDRDLVLGPVIEELDLDQTVDELSENVTASVADGTSVVDITVRSDSAGEASRIANAVATAFVEVAPSLEPQRADETAVVQITVTDPARVPVAPISPQPMINLVLGLLVGLSAGLAGAVMGQALNQRVQSEDDVRDITDAPVIGHVPDDPTALRTPLVSGASNNSVRAESLRQIRTNLQFLGSTAERQSYVVTSALAGDGKTLTALNLALTLADAGQRVCFVEADLHRPSVASYLALDEGAGLTRVLIGEVSWADVTQTHGTGLDVLPAGETPPNPSDLLAGARMDHVIGELEQAYDVVIVDAPALLSFTDAVILAKRCTGAIVVVDLGRKAPTRQELAESLEALATVDAVVLGLVLNRVPRRESRVRGRAQARRAPSRIKPGPRPKAAVTAEPGPRQEASVTAEEGQPSSASPATDPVSRASRS